MIHYNSANIQYGAVFFKFTFNTLRPRQHGRHFTDDIFKCIFLNEDIWISIKISLKFVPKGPINNIPALVQIMAWRRPGDKPLSELMVGSFLTHVCVTRPQWAKMANYKRLVLLTYIWMPSLITFVWRRSYFDKLFFLWIKYSVQ